MHIFGEVPSCRFERVSVRVPSIGGCFIIGSGTGLSYKRKPLSERRIDPLSLLRTSYTQSETSNSQEFSDMRRRGRGGDISIGGQHEEVIYLLST
jgi:hypothetical protein